MEKYQKEVSNIQLKIHGQYDTIHNNNMSEIFYMELDKESIDIDAFQQSYQEVAHYYSKGYEQNKEESDNGFVKEVISDMKRLIEIANMIKGK